VRWSSSRRSGGSGRGRLRACATFLLAAVPAFGQQASYERKGNLVSFHAPAGNVELEWLSASTFRLQRCKLAACPTRAGIRERTAFTLEERPGALEFRTQFLRVRLDRTTATVTVVSRSNKTVLTEFSAGDGVFEAAAVEGERFYGLGPRPAKKLDLRGQKTIAARPLLISSAGYGIYFGAPAQYEYDLAHTVADRVKVSAPYARRTEYFFYYGPSIKEILEEHVRITGAIGQISPGQVEILPPDRLPKHATQIPSLPFEALVAYLHHASLSGVLTPAVSLASVDHPAALYFPLLSQLEAPVGKVEARNRWIPYLYTYLEEVTTRGLPLLRPLLMQYPDEPAMHENLSAFMLGDELLIPVAAHVELPKGLWTDLCTNERHTGRRNVEIPNPGACPLAHNGAIVPIQQGARMELHYFPRLGGEFFLSEDGEPNITQVHAGPAGEYLRLEIESRVSRTYEWVVHHVSAVEKIDCTGCAGPLGDTRYDEKLKNYRVSINAAANSDIILNITLKEPL
jgi:hypothetical protein